MKFFDSLKDKLGRGGRTVMICAVAALTVAGGYGVYAATHDKTVAATATASPPGEQLAPADEAKLMQGIQRIQQCQNDVQMAQANLTAAQQSIRADVAELLAADGKSPKKWQVVPRQTDPASPAHLFKEPIPDAPATAAPPGSSAAAAPPTPTPQE